MRQLTHHDADDHHPAWSPDGGSIAFASDRDGDFDIWIVGIDAGEVSQLCDRPGRDDFPAFSPDGSMIAFSSGVFGPAELRALSLETSQSLTLVSGRDVLSPSWSPVGRRIAYAARTGANLDVWVVDAEAVMGRLARRRDP
ncbi:MAG: PD40 domain-containing protein [Gemmatimonadota bacterium]|nr:MAG: PD40 domain-containing protein [Gemmatimonadota bacterium]